MRRYAMEPVSLVWTSGQTVGRVIHKTLLVTDLRTIENVSVSIPNSVVLNSETLNYSKLAADRGLVHAAILDEFSTAGVEIMSPHYSALREGQSPTSPTTPTSPTSPLANQS